MVNSKTWNPAQIDQAIRRLEGIIRSGSYNPAELNQLLNQLGEPGYINTWNPAELDQKLRTLLHDLLTWKTATGNPIQLRTNNGGLVQSCEVTFSPIQSGSGEPSPSNIRPISGRDSLHLYVDTEQTETPETTHTATFPDTVYGGTDEVVGGVCSETFKLVTLTDEDEWTTFSEGKYLCAKLQVGEAKTVSLDTEYISNMYPFKGNGETASGGVTTDKRFYGQRMWGRIWVYDSDYPTLDSFKAMLHDNPLVVCYPLATPTEITLTPEDIELLTGANVLWTDGDSIEITYKKLLLPSDVESLSKIKKIEEKPKTKRSKKKKEE